MSESSLPRYIQEIYQWYPLTNCVSLLDKNRYACFSSPEHSIEDVADLRELIPHHHPIPRTLAFIEEPTPRISSRDLNEIFVVDTSRRNRAGIIPAPVRYPLSRLIPDVHVNVQDVDAMEKPSRS
jgi:hypothetical protein